MIINPFNVVRLLLASISSIYLTETSEAEIKLRTHTIIVTKIIVE